jgi:hypothetical protein
MCPKGGAGSAYVLLIDFRLDEPREITQRLLPAEIASLIQNGIRQTFLHDVQFGADRHFFQMPRAARDRGRTARAGQR